MKKFGYFCLLLVGLNPSAFAAEHDIGSHSYFRLSTGASTAGEQACYQAPGAGAKYRLGNECDK